MNLPKLVDIWKTFISKCNDQGVPLPMVRYEGKGNPALTLVVISTMLVIVGIVGKWRGGAGGIDESDAMQFFYASCTLFFGHSWVHKDSDGATDTLGDQK